MNPMVESLKHHLKNTNPSRYLIDTRMISHQFTLVISGYLWIIIPNIYQLPAPWCKKNSLSSRWRLTGIAVIAKDIRYLTARNQWIQFSKHSTEKRYTVYGPFVPWSKIAILGMVIPPLIGNPYNGYINPYYWVDDHPLLYGNNGSLDSSTGIRSIWSTQKYTKYTVREGISGYLSYSGNLS